MPLPHYDVIDLGTLGGSESSAVALNNNAQIIGQSDTLLRRGGKAVEEAFFWEKGRMTSLGEASVKAINNQAWIIGRGREEGGVLIWHGQEKRRTSSALLRTYWPYDINDSGEIVGWMRVPEETRGRNRGQTKNAAFFLSDGGLRLLENVSGSKISEARKINNNGCAVGSIMQPPTGESFTHHSIAAVWDKDGLRTINTLPLFDESLAIDVNDNGQVLCKAASNQMETLFDKEAARSNVVKFIQPADDNSVFRQQGFLYDNGNVEVLGSRHDGGFHLNIPRALNNHKQVVGTTGCGPTLSEVPHALLFMEGEIYDLNELIDKRQIWTLLDAKDVNDNGQVIGVGRFNGLHRGFLLDPK